MSNHQETARMSADTDRDAWQTARFSRLLLTGAAGGVGRQLRGRLASFAESCG
jgi:uronate dehydrogenase